MFRSRVAALTAALPVLAGALVAGAPSAQAACTAKADLPRKVVIDRSYREHRVPLRTTCSDLAYAGFDIVGPDGWDDFVYYDNETGDAKDYWDVYKWMTPGTYQTRDGGAFDYDYNALPVAEDTTKVKYAARAQIRSSRSGPYVTLGLTSTRYSPYARAGAGGYVPRGSITVSMQVKKSGSSTWQEVKRVKLDGSGRASVRVYASTQRYFRFTVAEGPKVWNTWSAATYR